MSNWSYILVWVEASAVLALWALLPFWNAGSRAHNQYYNMRPLYIGNACELFNQFVRICQDHESYKFEIRKRFLCVHLKQHAVLMNPMIWWDWEMPRLNNSRCVHEGTSIADRKGWAWPTGPRSKRENGHVFSLLPGSMLAVALLSQCPHHTPLNLRAQVRSSPSDIPVLKSLSQQASLTSTVLSFLDYWRHFWDSSGTGPELTAMGSCEIRWWPKQETVWCIPGLFPSLPGQV